NLFTGTVSQVRRSRRLRIDDRNCSRAIQSERQKPRKSIISTDSQRARLCPRKPSFCDEIVEKRMQLEAVVRIFLPRQRVGDLRSSAIEITRGVSERKAAVGNLFERSRDVLLEEDASVKPGGHVPNTRHLMSLKDMSRI